MEMRTNTRRIPVLFIHGLWLHASSWEKWILLYRKAGYEPMAPSWPGDSRTVIESRQHPERIANRSINDITGYCAKVIARLHAKPIVIGHSFGGLIVQKLLAQGDASAAIAIGPAQIKGIRHLPLVQLKNALPVLSRLSQLRGAKSLSQEQFYKTFGNTLTRTESDDLHAKYTIPAPGRPLFQAAIANLVPNSQAKVNVRAKRGPLLIIGGGEDQTVPEPTVRDTYRLYKSAGTTNSYKAFAGRGHSLTIDSGWREVADYTLAWLKKQPL